MLVWGLASSGSQELFLGVLPGVELTKPKPSAQWPGTRQPGGGHHSVQFNKSWLRICSSASLGVRATLEHVTWGRGGTHLGNKAGSVGAQPVFLDTSD